MFACLRRFLRTFLESIFLVLLELARACTILSLILVYAPIYSLPQGQRVIHGNASFTFDAKQMIIQASHNSVIEYDAFDIFQGETVRFLQDSVKARVLNRVIGQGASRVLGKLFANGQVYLINPQGIYFGKTAILDVGGLYAVSGALSNGDFLKKVDRFSNLQGTVSNAGSIKSGFAHLIGNFVSNTGSIHVDGTMATMIAGRQVLMGERDGHLHISFEANDAQLVEEIGVDQSGLIDAPEGDIYLGTGDLVYALSVRHTGRTFGKNIHIKAETGKLDIAGSLIASDETTGGIVEITGQEIELDKLLIEARGSQGGGSIFVGGSERGNGPLENARFVTFEENAFLDASAESFGPGGKVILWASDVMAAYGRIAAKGGSQCGDGGFVEVSGKELQFNSTVDLSSRDGKNGTLLLDPVDVLISTVGDLSPTSLMASLATADVLVEATNSITVDEAIVSNDGNTLTLQTTADTSSNSIVLNADITGHFDLKINAHENTNISVLGAVDVEGFHLQSGTWLQIAASLPSFNVGGNFVIEDAGTRDSGNNAIFKRASSGDGSLDSPYVIVDVYGLQGIDTINGSENSNSSNIYYKLGADIDASSTVNWNGGEGFARIGYDSIEGSNQRFSGHFDGDNHTIDGLFINKSNTSSSGRYSALFAMTQLGSTIDNVGVINANITGENNTGILVGLNKGVITNSYTSGVLVGGEHAGGLVGDNKDGGEIHGSYSSADVKGKSNVGGFIGRNRSSSIVKTSYSTGSVGLVQSGNSDVGGFVGENLGTIEDSYSRAFFYTGDPGSGADYVGGFVGNNNGGTISGSYVENSGQTVRGDDRIGGFAGRSNSNIEDSYSLAAQVLGDQYVGGFIGIVEGQSVERAHSVTNVWARRDAGGFVGKNQSTINESYSVGAVQIENVSGSSTNPSHLGGFVGINAGTINDSYSRGTVNVTSNSDEVGGFAGEVSSGKTIARSFSSSVVVDNGSTDTGGFAGRVEGAISDSFWDSEVSGFSSGAVGTGSGTYSGLLSKNTSEMMQEATFTAASWIVDGDEAAAGVWYINEGLAYPKHKWVLGDPEAIPSINALPISAGNISNQTVTMTDLFSFSLPEGSLMDFDETDTLSYSATLDGASLSGTWLSIDSSTGELSGTPTSNTTVSISISVADSEGGTASAGFDLIVKHIYETEPTVLNSLQDQSAVMSEEFSLALPGDTFSDDDISRGDSLSYGATLDGSSLSGTWLSIDSSTGELSGIPPSDGTYAVTVTATDQFGNTVESAFSLGVQHAHENQPFVSTALLDQSVVMSEEFSLALPEDTFSDDDISRGDSLSYGATLDGGSLLGTWLSIDSSTGELLGIPPSDGTYAVTVTATDQFGNSVGDDFSLHVRHAFALSPFLNSEIPDLENFQNELFEFILPEGTFLDEDVQRGDSLSYSAFLDGESSEGSWLNIDSTTGFLSGTPPELGTLDIELRARDNFGNSASATLFLEIKHPFSTAPTADDLEDQTLEVGEEFFGDFAKDLFQDVDVSRGDELRFDFNIEGDEDELKWLSLNQQTGVLSGEAPGVTGVFDVELIAIDGFGNEASSFFKIHVSQASISEEVNEVLSSSLNEELANEIKNTATGDFIEAYPETAAGKGVSFDAESNYEVSLLGSSGEEALEGYSDFAQGEAIFEYEASYGSEELTFEGEERAHMGESFQETYADEEQISEQQKQDELPAFEEGSEDETFAKEGEQIEQETEDEEELSDEDKASQEKEAVAEEELASGESPARSSRKHLDKSQKERSSKIVTGSTNEAEKESPATKEELLVELETSQDEVAEEESAVAEEAESIEPDSKEVESKEQESTTEDTTDGAELAQVAEEKEQQQAEKKENTLSEIDKELANIEMMNIEDIRSNLDKASNSYDTLGQRIKDLEGELDLMLAKGNKAEVNRISGEIEVLKSLQQKYGKLVDRYNEVILMRQEDLQEEPAIDILEGFGP